MKRALLRSLGRRALALCLLLIAVGSARASCAAEDRPLKHSILEVDLPIGQPSDRVIVRTDGDATEFDLFLPDDLRARLDYNQLRGLGAWMEEHVADLP